MLYSLPHKTIILLQIVKRCVFLKSERLSRLHQVPLPTGERSWGKSLSRSKRTMV